LSKEQDAEMHLLLLQDVTELTHKLAMRGAPSVLVVFGAIVDIKANLELIRTIARNIRNHYFLFVRDNEKGEALGLSVELSYTIGGNWQFAYLNGDYEEVAVQAGNALYFLSQSEKVKPGLNKARSQLSVWKPPAISEQQKWMNADYYLDAIIRSTHDAFIGKDTRNIIRFWNRGAEKLYGYSSAEAIGKHISIIVPPDRINELEALVGRVLQNKETVHRETVRRHKDGSGIEIALSLSPILDREGAVVGIAAIGRDIRERKKAEQEIRQQKDDLEAINRELRDFAHTISHDLKAPLRAVAHLSEWIYEDYIDRLDEAGRQNLQRLKSSVTRMSGLIDGVLNYSSIGRKMLKMEPVDLNALLQETISSLHVPEHVAIMITDNLPVVSGNRVQLGQVFQNLLNNALQNMDKAHGEIQVRSMRDNGEWRFSVRDNGRGIERAYFDRIFQPFQTLTPRDGVKSTGIGLSIVRKIIEVHGGKIWLESEPGRGTVFYFTLPVKNQI
jgi:PAS domain S-box-containing protein